MRTKAASRLSIHGKCTSSTEAKSCLAQSVLGTFNEMLFVGKTEVREITIGDKVDMILE